MIRFKASVIDKKHPAKLAAYRKGIGQEVVGSGSLGMGIVKEMLGFCTINVF